MKTLGLIILILVIKEKIYTKINKSIDNHFYNICAKLDQNEKVID